MIVLLHGARAYGAVESYVAELAGGLRERGRAAVLVHADDPALAPFASVAGGSVRIEAVPGDALLGSATRGIETVVRLLRRLRPDVVHVTDVWPVAMLAARIARVPRVLVTHHTPELPRRDSLVGRTLWHAAWATRPDVIYTSEADRRGDGDRPHGHVVYYGIDLERFRNGTPRFEHAGPVVGNAARLVPQKGLDTLLDAAPVVLERHPAARFVLVGDGPSRADLERRAAERGVADRVVFAGHSDDVPGWLASFDVFALPSLFEGLCYAVIEAQAAGVPVVATPVGGVRETVVDGETGLVVPPRDPAALAGALLRLLDDRGLRWRLADEAGRRVERFALSRMVEETIALYRLSG